VVLRLAQRHPSKLAGVIPIAPAGLEMSRLLFLVERDPVLRSLLAIPAPLPSAVLRAAVARLYLSLGFASPRRIGPEIVSTFTWHHRHRSHVARYLDTLRRLVPELRDAFDPERISVPVLLVWGDRDRLVFHRGAGRILAAVPGSRLEVLQGVGHCPQVEAPERFTDLLLSFSGEAQRAVA
jgi:pimeloyl-ACP methyl ester carboxylesterase